jgi:hypothetical protein
MRPHTHTLTGSSHAGRPDEVPSTSAQGTGHAGVSTPPMERVTADRNGKGLDGTAPPPMAVPMPSLADSRTEWVPPPPPPAPAPHLDGVPNATDLPDLAPTISAAGDLMTRQAHRLSQTTFPQPALAAEREADGAPTGRRSNGVASEAAEE